MKYILLFSPMDIDTAYDWAILDTFSTLAELYEQLEKEIEQDLHNNDNWAYRIVTDY